MGDYTGVAGRTESLDHLAMGSCKAPSDDFGFTTKGSLISCGVFSADTSLKGTSNTRDWYKQTSSSLQ